MTAQAISVPETTAVRPYLPSWFDRLLDAIERLPFPAPISYAAVWVVCTVAMWTEPWLLGAASPWEGPQKLYWGSMVAAQLAGAAYLRRTAWQSFEAFRSALQLAEPEIERLRYELSVVPPLPAVIAVLGGFVSAAAVLLIDPTVTTGVELTGVLQVAAFVLVGWITAVTMIVLLQLIRQMRLIRRILARSATIDVFRPGPLHAFSRLTARGGALIVLLTASSVLAVPSPAGGALATTWIPFFVIPPLLAIAAFVLPVYGMHERLVGEKERLQGEAEHRLQALFDEINRDVDARQVGRLDALNRATAAVIGQREVLAKLPTWPWSTGTLRGFVTAIFLPLGLFVLQRIVEQLV